MANILDSIRYLFSKKDDITPPVIDIPQAISNVANVVGSIKPLPFGPALKDIQPMGTVNLGQIAGMAKIGRAHV